MDMKVWQAVPALLFWAGAATAGDEGADKVLACMRANVPKTVQVKHLELTSTDRTGGERMLKGRLYGTNEDGRLRAMMRIEAPADLAGAGYLLREGKKGGDEMYVFVPALNKVRRITGASVDGALWGTDLSYADVKQIQNAFSETQSRLEAASEVEGKAVHVVSMKPAVEQGSRYTQIRAWIEQKTCVTLKVDFLQGSTVRKRLTAHPKDLKESGGRWYAAELLVADLKEGTKTRVKVTGVSNDRNVPDRMFNPATFHVGG